MRDKQYQNTDKQRTVQTFGDALVRVVDYDGCYFVQGGWDAEWFDISLGVSELGNAVKIARIYMNDGYSD